MTLHASKSRCKTVMMAISLHVRNSESAKQNRSVNALSHDPATAILCMLSSKATGLVEAERGTKHEGQALCTMQGLIIWLSTHLS